VAPRRKRGPTKRRRSGAPATVLAAVATVGSLIAEIGDLIRKFVNGYDQRVTSRQINLKQHELRTAVAILETSGGPNLRSALLLAGAPTDNETYVDQALGELEQEVLAEWRDGFGQ